LEHGASSSKRAAKSNAYENSRWFSIHHSRRVDPVFRATTP